MNRKKYFIVGDGFAAMFFAHQLIKNNISFTLFSERRKSASQVSAGIVNPVVLKKFTSFWLAKDQIESLQNTISEIAEYTGNNYLINEQIHRIFHDEIEKQLWIKKSSSEDLSPFLDTDFSFHKEVVNPFGAGKVRYSFRLDVTNFFKDLLNYLENNNLLTNEKFDYSLLDTKNKTYKNLNYEKIVFCEGMGVVNNPFFNWIPVNANKGHCIKVNFLNEFNSRVTFKKKHFLFPLDHKNFYYGGTYDRNSQNDQVDDTAVQQLINGLKEFCPEDFTITETNVGFRPTVKDRRPIIGNHSKYGDLFVFNGLGARGILNGNFFGKELFNHIENNLPLHPEIDLKRFSKINNFDI